MKKLFALCLSVLLLAGCSNTTDATEEQTSAPTSTAPQTTAANEEVNVADTFTSASLTRTVLSDADLSAAYENLTAISNDLATLAISQEEGYAQSRYGGRFLFTA